MTACYGYPCFCGKCGGDPYRTPGQVPKQVQVYPPTFEVPRDYDAEVSRAFAYQIQWVLSERADAWLRGGGFWRRLLGRLLGRRFRRELAELLYEVHDDAIEDAASISHSYRIEPVEGQLYMDGALRARRKARPECLR